MLFWAEGSKTKNSIVFTNTDVNMLKIFIKFLKYLGVNNDQIHIAINCFVNNETYIDSIHNFWENELNIVGCKFNKPTIKLTDGKIGNYGVCRITIYNTRLVQQIFGAIQEYAEFNNDFCLNGKISAKL